MKRSSIQGDQLVVQDDGFYRDINVLGTKYSIYFYKNGECDGLDKDGKWFCSGFCDHSSRRVVLRLEDDDADLEDYIRFRKKILRHEIIHAFLFESGLNIIPDSGQSHNEIYVDWFAMQYPKMKEVFKELDIEE